LPVSESRRRVAPFAALAAAVALLGLVWVVAGDDDDTVVASSFLIGKPAPQVASELLDGDRFDLSRRKGSWVVINFFQSTCLPCKAEHPELVRFVDQQRVLGPQGAEFYTVVYEDSDPQVREFFDEFGGDWPIVRDADGAISVAFGVTKVPETWIIDPNGVVVRRYAGQVTAEGLALDLQRLRDASGL
jgi:cytochrome c biogenesis protein CcmG, thiol:disulfide interchange protein DsbE